MSCNKKIKPEMTQEQVLECRRCKHISGKKIWCCKFGFSIVINKKPKILKPIIKPTITQMATNFTTAMLRWAKSGLKTVDKIEYIRRRSICSDCSGGWRCPYCGCALGGKAAIATETCPEGRWDNIKKKIIIP